MLPDDDICYQALTARDSRFDGRFFAGVLSTGIYCRPVCPARTPHRRNVRFFGSAAAASAAGLRACRRCRPDSLPGSREWDHRGDLVARALRLIGSGHTYEADELAQRLHVSSRHLNRALVAEVGATSGQLMRTRRAQSARLLLEQTDLSAADVAFTAGFGSVRQFNDVIREHFGLTPRQLRVGTGARSSSAGTLDLRLKLRPPYAVDAVLGWLARHAVPGVDDVDPGRRRVATRTIDGVGVTAWLGPESVRVSLALPTGADLRAVPRTIAAIRRWLDLDVAPTAVDAALGRDPRLAELVRRRPGLRVLGALDPFRSLTTTIVGQQVSVAAAATQNARLCALVGDGTAFPTAAALASWDPERVAVAVGVPKARGRTLVDAATLIASGEVSLDPAGDRDDIVATLGQIKGVGPWTVADVRMRCLADPDVWPGGDLVLRRALAPGGRFAGLEPAAVAPWRSYLAHHVWVANADPKQEAA